MTRDLPLPEGSVVTVGSFDGVHRGHQAVLEEIARRARATGRASVLVTFEPHPMAVVNPTAAPRVLTTPAERREVLAQTALDYAVFLRFDAALRALTPEAFVRRVLVERFGVRELVIGADHGFGHGRSGDVSTLQALGRAYGFAVDVVPPVHADDGRPISSSRVRQAVAEGRLDEAAHLLGRAYTLTGTVVPGARRGHGLGFPTANVAVPDAKLLPPDGVWAVRVEWPGGRGGGMMNQGPRPTVGDARHTVEAHLFGFAGDLYGAAIRIEWVARLREVRRFESLEALAAQLAQDAGAARAVLARPGTMDTN